MLAGMTPVVFTPKPMAMVQVCEPDDTEALANLAAVFGQPQVLATWCDDLADWWRCPHPSPASRTDVNAHLRDFHRTLDSGATSHLTRNVNESLNYHWQLHQQVLVHPLPIKHFHQ